MVCMLCRCLRAHGNPTATTGGDYVGYVLPIGHPDTGAICGRPWCAQVAVMWLKAKEANDYLQGVRVFSGPNNFTKVKAMDGGVVWNAGCGPGTSGNRAADARRP